MQNTKNNTPIIKIDLGIEKVNIFAKCEYMSKTLSIKDRVAKYMLEQAYKSGKLKKGQNIVEASSGNMGASIAAIAREYNSNVHIVCPEKTSPLKRKMIESYGAKLTVVPNCSNSSSSQYYANVAKKIAKEENAYLVNQYDSILNRDCHYHTTGAEIVEYFTESKLNLDYFITVGGSGGTVTGCAKRIKESLNTKVIMPDPVGSIYYDLFTKGKIIKENIRSYKVEGPGNPKMCTAMDLKYIDEVQQFTDEDAFNACNTLATQFGLLVGHSSGANFFIANKLAEKLKNENLKEEVNILILLADSGIKYF